jgi:hypothetical protein
VFIGRLAGHRGMKNGERWRMLRHGRSECQQVGLGLVRRARKTV